MVAVGRSMLINPVCRNMLMSTKPFVLSHRDQGKKRGSNEYFLREPSKEP